MGFPRRLHDPSAVLDYPMDWSAWLASGEVIISAEVTAPDDIQIAADPEIIGGTIVKPFISGGANGLKYDVRYHIATNQGREEDRSITLVVKER